MQRSDMTLAHVWQCGLHVAVSGVRAASANRYKALDPRFTGVKVLSLVAVHVDRAQVLCFPGIVGRDCLTRSLMIDSDALPWPRRPAFTQQQKPCSPT